ncbi:MAG: 2-oxoacid:acceptor oxidoreductase subunit alpha [Candidatus Humimicrobiaceae bacterium]|jgi:2-oxoglutarate ferredoxin oxidoreductase subunit alpha|nr:2-oxoacid:acceptor oxidoreductase subunit alpha [Actinomycetota bacterium]MDY0027888.1 2-oxoacid:acceptor oxidoreductase subunit alpha [Candidatus Humimicrobiaceae bacterium]
MKVSNISWKIGGEAGDGIITAGLIFSKMFARKGYFVVDCNEYPSLIRGGHSSYTVRIGSSEIFSTSKDINILVALNEETVRIHQEEVLYGGYIICDDDSFDIADFKKERKDINYIAVPFSRIISELKVPEIGKNSISLGASAALLNYDIEVLKEVIADVFSEKSPEIVELNVKLSEFGYKYIKEKLKLSAYELEIVKPVNKILVTGNDAVFLGAVRAGCKFYAAYPMTPSSSILHSFASVENDFNIITRQAEDDIAVINMVLGASYAGVRAMAATSGGGFSLMNEGIGSAAMTETPIVIVLCQRPAPATGMPTWTEQGDLLFACHASHGEFPRVIMAPGDPEECFYLTGRAFNLADRYQIPVIIMLDKYLSENHFSYDRFDFKSITVNRGKLITSSSDINEEYNRYTDTDNGISPRTIPGVKGGVYIANSDEHDQYGYSDENSRNRKIMVDKRFKKMKKLIEEVPPPRIYGPHDAEITIWSWGSCKGPILEAMNILNQKEKKVNFIHFTYLYPFDSEIVSGIIKESNKNIIIENNKTSQLSKIIMMNTGYKIKNKILKYSGRQFLPEEIASGIEKIE